MYSFPPEDLSTLNFTCSILDGKYLFVKERFENILRLCVSIGIYYDDRVDYLTQFSFYISLKKVLRTYTSYVSAGINGPYVILSGYQAAIHYTAMHNIHKFIKNHVLLRKTSVGMDFVNITYYLSFSKTFTCPHKFSFFIEVRLSRSVERYELDIFHVLLFSTPYSYYKLMDSEIVISADTDPLCDVVINFQRILTKKTNKFQETCNTGFLQVSFL